MAAKYCPIIKDKVLYLDCQECEDKVFDTPTAKAMGFLSD